MRKFSKQLISGHRNSSHDYELSIHVGIAIHNRKPYSTIALLMIMELLLMIATLPPMILAFGGEHYINLTSYGVIVGLLTMITRTFLTMAITVVRHGRILS